jgi:hypothetical protein
MSSSAVTEWIAVLKLCEILEISQIRAENRGIMTRADLFPPISQRI